jgi:hypothetical protein
MLPFDEIKSALAEWLNPEDEKEEEFPSDGKLTVEAKTRIQLQSINQTGG